MRVVNQITFEAKDEAEALRLAGERLGKEAVLLSTRTVHVGGIFGFFQRPVLMFSAGILQDEQAEARAKGREKERDADVNRENLAAFRKMLELKQAAETRSGQPDFPPAEAAESVWSAPAEPIENSAKVIYSPAGVAGGNGRISHVVDSVHLSSAGLSSAGSSPLAAEAAPRQPNGVSETEKLREEVASLSKQLRQIESLLQRGMMAGEEKKEEEEEELPAVSGSAEKNFLEGLPGISGPEPPVPALDVSVSAAPRIEDDEFYRKLLSAEVDPLYARQMVEEYRLADGRAFAEWLETKVRCAANTPSRALGGRKVMLIGPTGVGKTTTIAKLTAIQALQEQKKVLLLTSDTYRIAAVDQLQTYAKILGVPIEVIYEVENFVSILGGYADSELILLDTAGRGQKDRKNLDTCEILYDAFRPDAVHLVLSANMKYRDMQDIVARMAVVPISHVIFTKMDETVSYGALFNVMKLLNRPLSFLTTGQNVPNDIEVASGSRFVNLLLGNGQEFR
ncbi:MAG: flagellar biosynthesis protein FlhF [Synergistaceae bacterium]|jgi:flagellar biosynthesis protein FlhF|nr:flagellar biosynthesis protein FlhF [Synergistaceae bacterium]